MATLALPLIAGAIGAEIGVSAGVATFLALGASAAGSYLDNKYVLPELFGVPATKSSAPPKVGDIFIQGNSEGSEANVAYGRNARMAGTVIWQNEKLIKEGTDYFSHIGIHICRGLTEQVKKVWADGKLIYDAANRGVTLTEMYIRRDSNSIIPFGQSYFRLPNRGPFTDYTRNLKVGKPVTITGHPNPDHDGDYNVAYRDEFGLIINDFPLGEFPLDVTVGPQTMSFYQEEAAWDTRFQEITFYNGTDTQNPDPLLVSLEGGTYPAHRGDTYMVLEKMALKDWGNRQPSAFSFLVTENSARTVGETIGMVLEGANLQGVEYDVTGLNDPDQGFVVHGITSPLASLRTFMFAHNISVQNEGETLYFFKKEDATTVDVDVLEFGARETGSDEPEPFNLSLLTELDQPSQVSVKYSDPAKDYQTGEQSDRRRDLDFDRTQAINIQNITLTSDQARNVATRELYRISAESAQVQFSLPPSQISLQEGDIIRTTFESELYTIRITSMSIGANFQVKGQGIVIDKETFVDIDSVTEPPSSGGGSTVPTLPAIQLHVMDLAPMRGGDHDDAGIYLAVAAGNRNDTFFGAQVFDSTDDINYILKTGSTTEFAMGTALSVLQNAVSDTAFEYGYTLDIELIHGTISSVTEADVTNAGVNRWLIGNEVLYVVNSTPLATPGQFRLEGFLRGARDTFDEAANHVIGERVVTLDPNTMNFLSLNLADKGTTRYYKGVSTGAAESTAIGQSKVVELNTLRPFSPGTVQGTYAANDDLTITWVRRSREFVGAFPPPNLPLVDAPPETYEVEVLDAPGGNVVRTETIVALNTWFYARNLQTSDGVIRGGPIDFRLYQVGPFYGRGKPAIVQF